MSRRLLFALLLLTLTSCQLKGPYDHVSGLSGDGNGVRLILERHWDWEFTSYQKRHRSEYYLVDVVPGEPVQLSRPKPLFAGGAWEEAQFIPVQGTDEWVALVKNTDKLRLAIWLTRLKERPTTRGARKLRELDLEEDAYAVTRSGRHLLTVTNDGLAIYNLLDGTIVEQRPDGSLVELRREILTRFGDSGPGTWWLSDDLRFVAFVPPWTLEDGTPVESMPAALFGVDLDLRNDGLVYDRQLNTFRRCHRLVELGLLRDIQTNADQLLLLYAQVASTFNAQIGVIDLDLGIHHRQELPARFSVGEQHVHWSPSTGRVHLAGKVQSSPDRPFRIYTWDVNREQITALDVPRKAIEDVLQAID